MKIKVSWVGSKQYMADMVDKTGSPPVGYGKTVKEALGDLLYHAGKELGIELELPKAEYKRIYKEFEKRR